MKTTLTHFAGKALTPKELKQLIISSRKSGTISMEKAHRQIRKKLNGNQQP